MNPFAAGAAENRRGSGGDGRRQPLGWAGCDDFIAGKPESYSY
jgi:hypothetical protein